MSGSSAASLAGQQIEVLRERGFVVIRGFAPARICAELRSLAQADLRQAQAPVEYEADLRYPGAPASREAQGGHTVRRLLNAYGRHEQYRRWATSPEIREWLGQCFGETPVLSTAHHNCVMTKHPAYGSLTGWHQDVRYWSFSSPDLVSCWLALGRETFENGGLSFVPGSHAADFGPQCYDERKFFRDDLPENRAWIERAECPELEAGDVVFFHCRTLHAAQGNATGEVKFSLVHTYHPESCTPLPGTRSASMPDVPLR